MSISSINPTRNSSDIFGNGAKNSWCFFQTKFVIFCRQPEEEASDAHRKIYLPAFSPPFNYSIAKALEYSLTGVELQRFIPDIAGPFQTQ